MSEPCYKWVVPTVSLHARILSEQFTGCRKARNHRWPSRKIQLRHRLQKELHELGGKMGRTSSAIPGFLWLHYCPPLRYATNPESSSKPGFHYVGLTDDWWLMTRVSSLFPSRSWAQAENPDHGAMSRSFWRPVLISKLQRTKSFMYWPYTFVPNLLIEKSSL